jgi:c-di-GMP-binding flagellar brake protein YcgR
MGEFVVKHFRRANASADAKELITEIVVEGSDTGRFLRRMEETRLTRPCFQTIDMRGRVAGECRRYAFNDRIHFLDDISFELFEKGLLENNGVYTVGTFEAIVGGAHTLLAQADAREQAERRRRDIEQRRAERAREAALEIAGAGVDSAPPRGVAATPVDNPEQLPLGYFRKRAHPRLQYACAVTLTRGNISTSGTTRDISVGGMRVHIRGLTAFKPGQNLQVNFRGLLNAGGEPIRESAAYRIVAIESLENETAVSLKRLSMEHPAGLSELLEDLVAQRQRKYKLDMEDEYQSVLSWLYERSYAQSATQVPFFVERNDAGDPGVQAVAMSEGNVHLARFFCTDADNYNFTPLCLPHRLQRLQEGGSFVLAMYRQRGEHDQCMRIHSAADFESASPQAFHRLVAWVLEQTDYCIVKVHAGAIPALPVPATKIDEVSQRLQYKSETQMGELRARLQRLNLVGFVIDLTQEYRDQLGCTAADCSGAAVWVGGEYRSLTDESVQQKLSLPPEHLQPELVRFGYVERRREDRYLAETRVDVRIGDKLLQGMSRDISTRGMRIQLDRRVAVKKGITVKLGLVSLQQKKSSTNLMDIPYRVVGSSDQDAGTMLRLERVLGGKNEGLKEFFVELITKNQHKLGVDIGDIWGAAASRAYEALVAANVAGIPFFIGRSDEGGAHLQFVGVPESPGSLLEWFRVGEGLDFRCLNEPRVVTALYDAVQIQLRQARVGNETPAPFELELYAYRDYDEISGETFIHAVSELDFGDDARRENFLARMAGYDDWRCLKLTATFTRPIDEKALEKMIDVVRAQSRHRAIRLSDLAHSLVGYGELVDITDEWLALKSSAAAESAQK